MNYTLAPHQLRVKKYGLKNPYFILAAAPGAGKTLIALDLAHTLKQKLLVVAPSSLCQNWVDEINLFFPGKKVDVLKNESSVYTPWDTDIVIVSYENVKNSGILFKWADMVVADEAHFLKTMESQRSEAFHRFIYEYSVKRCILMSGTPIKGKVHEFYSQIAICNYNPTIKKSEFLEKFHDSIDFADHFSKRIEYNFEYAENKFFKVLKWAGIKNIPELKKYLQGIYIRVKEEEFNTVGKSVYHFVDCSLSNNPDLLKAFKRFDADHSDANTISAKVDSAILTVPYTIQTVEKLLDTVDKVVVFSDHREPTMQIAKHFGVDPILGGMNDAKKYKIKNGFQFGRDKVICGTIGSLGTGYTLTAAHHTVVNDPNWTPGDMEQLAKRTNRMGQTKQCHVHLMISSPQARFIYETLQEKQDVINLAL